MSMRFRVTDVEPFVPGSPWEAELTTASSYGKPVLRLRHQGEVLDDFGPDDLLTTDGMNFKAARQYIAAWVQLPERTEDETKAVGKFLGKSLSM